MAKRRSLETPELPILCWRSSKEPSPKVNTIIIIIITIIIVTITIIIVITFAIPKKKLVALCCLSCVVGAGAKKQTLM